MKTIFATMMVAVAAAASMNAYAGGDAEAGKALLEKSACASCHGKNFNEPIDPSYPKLAGQHQDYLEHAMIAYQRADGPNGRNNAIMGAQVKPLSKKDIQNIAAYISSLPGSLVLRK